MMIMMTSERTTSDMIGDLHSFQHLLYSHFILHLEIMNVKLIILAVLSSYLVESMASPFEFAEKAHNRQARALGAKKKGPKVNKYPWDPTQNKNVQLSYTDTMKKHMKPEEEPFRDDYYEDYDFEFPKGMIRNDNHEVKKLRDMRRRLEG